jgi:ribosomal protein S18 acetylase RimI-like enzyme
VLAQYPVDRFPALRSYTGTYHGKVAAIGCLFIGHDTIGIYDIVTREEFRGVGIGSAMFAHLIETAKSFGSRYAVLQASPDGIGIYRRAGFMSVGTVHTFENRKMLETAQPSVQQRKVLDLGC